MGDDNRSQDIDNIEIEVKFIGKFQNSKVTFATELGPGRLLSVEEQGHLNLWDTETGRIINSEAIKFSPTACGISADKKTIIFGTKQGVLRAIDTSSGLVKEMWEKTAMDLGLRVPVQKVQCQTVGEHFCVKFEGSNQLYFFRTKDSEDIVEVLGMLPFETELLDFVWLHSQKQPTILALLTGGVAALIPVRLPEVPLPEALANLSDSFGDALVRKVDTDSEKISLDLTEESFYAYGPSLVFRKYKYPTEPVVKLDQKTKVPPNPTEELVAFDLMPQQALSDPQNFYFGCENGEVGVYRMAAKKNSCRLLLSIQKNGCSFLGKTTQNGLIVGGFDGSLFLIPRPDEFFEASEPLKFEVSGDAPFIHELTTAPTEPVQAEPVQPTEEQPQPTAPENPESHEKTHSQLSRQLSRKMSKSLSKHGQEIGSFAEKSAILEAQAVAQEKRNSLRKGLGVVFKETEIAALAHKEVVTSSFPHRAEAEAVDVQQQMFDAHMAQIQAEKDLKQQEVLKILQEYQAEYTALQQRNDRLDDSHRLTPDELCIDVEKQRAYQTLAEEVTQEMRDRAKKEVTFYDLLHTKLKGATFASMDIHLKGMAGLMDKVGVFNFPITKVTQTETKALAKMSRLRRMDRRERDWHFDNGTNKEGIDQFEDFLAEPQPEFLVNGGFGKQKMVLTDFEQREKELKEYEEEKRKKKEMLQNANNTNVSRRIELVNRRRRKKKNLGKTFGPKGADTKKLTPETQETTIKARSSVREAQKQETALYSSLELTTRHKKIAQMAFIKQYIRQIKEEFNLDFEAMFKIREKKLDGIAEINKKIREICQELAVEDESIVVASNIIEK